MKIESHQAGSAVVLTLNGRFDANVMHGMRKALETAVESSNGNVVVNLQGVNFVDSNGLATLVQGMKHCRDRKGDLRLSNLQQSVRIIFELTRLDKAFGIFATEADALRALAQA